MLCADKPLVRTYCSVVAIWERFIGSLSHEFPLIVFVLAFDNLIVQFLESFRVLNCCERFVILSNKQVSYFGRHNAVNLYLLCSILTVSFLCQKCKKKKISPIVYCCEVPEVV